MNPNYTFQIDYGSGAYQPCFPIWGAGLSVVTARESGEQYFRRKLSGELKFIGADFTRILATALGQKITIKILSPDFVVWRGSFYKSDCEIDLDARMVTVTPSVEDAYGAILDAMDNEYNLASLAPAVQKIQMDKRPMVQLYALGDDKITCYLSGMTWEQDAEVITTHAGITAKVFSPASDWYYFAAVKSNTGGLSDLPDLFYMQSATGPNYGGISITKDGYTLVQLLSTSSITIQIRQGSTVLYSVRAISTAVFAYPYEVRLAPSSGSGMTGEVVLYLQNYRLYSRMLCDVTEVAGNTTSPIPDDDITSNSNNYHYCIGYGISGDVFLQEVMSSTPTEWGQSELGNYYVKPEFPAVLGISNAFPIAKNNWTEYSLWWAPPSIYWLTEESARARFTLQDSYPLWSVLSVLLEKAGAGLTFAGTAEYSDFLYGANAVRGNNARVFITPKTNITAGEYENAAQRGDISLRGVLDMLRDCFRCYWFIEDGKLRIEHVYYFQNGGSYTDVPSVGMDLTAIVNCRSGRALDYGQGKYKYNLGDTYGRIQFEWMDAVTEPFNGEPVDITDGYVNRESVKQVTISQFSSDIDYMLLAPENISKDGFALLMAVEDGGEWVLPYWTQGDNDELVLQNGFASFLYLVRYYLYDLCALNYEIAGDAGVAHGETRKMAQSVRFPVDPDWLDINGLDVFALIKTTIGSGAVESISINLSSLEGEAQLLI